MKKGLFLSSALALLMATGTAYAGSNRAYVHENGDDNTAAVLQQGGHNSLGSGSGGVGAFDAYQDGDNNSLDVTQKGNGNSIGSYNAIQYSAGYNSVPTYKRVPTGVRNAGVDQKGDYNSLIVKDQVEGGPYNNGNTIVTIKQKSSDSATGPTNLLTISQDNGNGTSGSAVPSPGSKAYNLIGDVYQNNTGSGGAVDENTVTIGQHTNGLDGYGHGNRLDILTQDGTGNTADVLQIGVGNIVNNLSQIGTGHVADVDMTNGNDNYIKSLEQSGHSQSATVNMTGSNNGINGWHAGQGYLAGLVGATPNVIHQEDGTGTGGNTAALIIPGSYNAYGIFQSGTGNDVGSMTLSGDDNDLGVYQTGTTNTLALSTVSGSYNDIGVYQNGTSNISTVDVLGDHNHVGTGQWGTGNQATLSIDGGSNIAVVLQDGTDNVASVTTTGSGSNITGVGQLGYENNATFTIDGGNNIAIGLQDNTGGTTHGNTMTVSITGSDNNALVGGSVASFSGQAGDASSNGPTVGGLISGLSLPGSVSGLLSLVSAHAALTPGVFAQAGKDNTLGLTVTSSNNLFATVQKGDSNTITGLIGGGTLNQAAVAQVGNSNVANMSQSGAGNNMGIVQTN